ncbi:hypothetical protein HK105_201701 [Polyrhizophydium stewartii]|uniref:HMG box domain-containing protein n=1 Tax=Polyrhizophydium stewartii TaxID=2732419 RepID=A0ABR4NH79_9FUNG
MKHIHRKFHARHQRRIGVDHPRGEQPASPSPLARGVKRAASPLPDDAPRPPVNRVKRPMNPFMMYCAAVRPLIKQKFGRLTSQAISKHAAEMWRLEPESVRDGFREMSRIAHERRTELNQDFTWMLAYRRRVNRQSS